MEYRGQVRVEKMLKITTAGLNAEPSSDIYKFNLFYSMSQPCEVRIP
jgi:hypothetical protein